MHSDTVNITVQLQYVNFTTDILECPPATLQLSDVGHWTTHADLITHVYRTIILKQPDGVVSQTPFNGIQVDIFHSGVPVSLHDTVDHTRAATTYICVIRRHASKPVSASKHTVQASAADADNTVAQINSMVTSDMLAPLLEMGFSQQRATKALLLSMFNTELAIEWLFNHSDDVDIDEPLTQRQLLSFNRVLGLFGHSSSAGRLGRVIGSAGLGSALELLSRSGGVISLDDLTGSSATTAARDDMFERVQQSIDDNVCTYHVTGNKFAAQNYRCCHTCNLIDGQGVCIACANVCHKDHELGELIESDSFFCDCRESDQPCMAVKRAAAKADIKPVISAHNKYNTYTREIAYSTAFPFNFLHHVDFIKVSPAQLQQSGQTLQQLGDRATSTGDRLLMSMLQAVQVYYDKPETIKKNSSVDISQYNWFSQPDTGSSADNYAQQLLMYGSTVPAINHEIANNLMPTIVELFATSGNTIFLSQLLLNLTSQPGNIEYVVPHHQQIVDIVQSLYSKQHCSLSTYASLLTNLCLLASDKHPHKRFNVPFVLDAVNDCLLEFSSASQNSTDSSASIRSLLFALSVLFHRRGHEYKQACASTGLTQTVQTMSCDIKRDTGKFARLLLNIIQQQLETIGR